MLSVTESCFTHNPRSAMAQLKSFFTKMFLDFKSRWAMPGLPARQRQNVRIPSVPMPLAGVTLGSDDLHVKMRQTVDDGFGHLGAQIGRNGARRQKVKERSVLVEFGD